MMVGLALNLFEKRGLTFYQNSLLSKTEFTPRFAKWSFLAFFPEINAKISSKVSVLSRKNLFQSVESFITVLCKSFVMNFPCFFLR